MANLLDRLCNDLWFIIFKKLTFQTCVRLICCNKWMARNGWFYISRFFVDKVSKMNKSGTRSYLNHLSRLQSQSSTLCNLRRFDMSDITSRFIQETFAIYSIHDFLIAVGHQLTHLNILNATSIETPLPPSTLSPIASIIASLNIENLRSIAIRASSISGVESLELLFKSSSRIKHSHIRLHVRDDASVQNFLQVLCFSKCPLKTMTLELDAKAHPIFIMESLVMFANNHVDCLFDVFLPSMPEQFVRYFKNNIGLKGVKALKNTKMNKRHMVFWLQKAYPNAGIVNWMYILLKSRRPATEKLIEFDYLLSNQNKNLVLQKEDQIYFRKLFKICVKAGNSNNALEISRLIAKAFDIAYLNSNHEKIRRFLSKKFVSTKPGQMDWIFMDHEKSEYKFLNDGIVIKSIVGQPAEFKHQLLDKFFYDKIILERVLSSETAAKDPDIFACFLSELTQTTTIIAIEERGDFDWYIGYFFVLLKHHRTTFESICTQQYTVKTKWVNFSISEPQLRHFCLRNKTIREGLSKILDPVFAFTHFWPYSNDDIVKSNYFDIIRRCVNHHSESMTSLVKTVLLGTGLNPTDKVRLFSRLDDSDAVISTFNMFKKMGVMNADNSRVFSDVKRLLLGKRKIVPIYEDDEHVEARSTQRSSRKRSKRKS